MGIRSSVRRHPRRWAAGALATAGLIVFGLVWFEPQKLFLDQEVDEALPTAAASSPVPAPATAPDTAGSATPATGTSPLEEHPAASATTSPEPPAASDPPDRVEVLARGQFRSLEHS